MEKPAIHREGLSPDAIDLIEHRPDSIGALIDWRVRQEPDAVGWRYPNLYDVWQDLTWSGFRERVHRYAAAFLARGLTSEQRVAIIGSTRIEWILLDLGVNCAGGATTTVYPNTQPDECHYILKDSESVMVVVESPEILARVAGEEGIGPEITTILLMTGEPDPADARQVSLADFDAQGAAHLAERPDCVREAISETGPQTLATIIYTSGTTGRPKGVELTHDNWIYEAASMKTLDILQRSDTHFLWLPMSHVFGKCLVIVDIFHGCVTAVDGRIDHIVSNLAIIRPTLMCGAPRIFEKVRAAVMTSSPRQGIKGKIARWAFATGRQARPYRIAGKRLPRTLAVRYAVADKLVFRKLRDTLGGRIRFLISGSAKLSPQVQEWFYSAGIVIAEGYGMTESTAISFLNPPSAPKFGYVGSVAPGSQVKIADDGEILIKGPGVTRGYHNDPQRTADTLQDGWLRTGDIGELDATGDLRITDRKKDLIKTSGGKYVSPQEVEAVVAANCPYVSQVVAVGEGRKYVSALLVLDRDSLLKWAKKRNIDKDYAELTQLPEIRRSIDRFIDRANSKLERWETVKRYAILDHELSVDSGDVTPNMKVRRQRVIQRYADIVDSLYDADVPADA